MLPLAIVSTERFSNLLSQPDDCHPGDGRGPPSAHAARGSDATGAAALCGGDAGLIHGRTPHLIT